MKFLTEKGIVHKLIIAIVIVLLFNFMAPTISSAGIGGILFEPIQSLLLVIADGIMSLSQSWVFNMGSTSTFITIQDPSADTPVIWGWVVGILVGVAVVVGSVLTGGGLALIAAGVTGVIIGNGVNIAVTALITDTIPLKFKLPIFIITPESIFSNELPLLDVNFFENSDAKADKYNAKNVRQEGNKYYIEIETASGQKVEQPLTTMTLQPTISKWYYALRNFAIIALLIILVYIGIRIVISSAADDRAKYKQKLMDWLVAMCLLFFMHYIMVFAVTLTEEITKALNSANMPYYVSIGNKSSKLKEYIYGEGAGESTGSNMWDSSLADEFRSRGVIVTDNGDEYFMWPTTLMGKARIELQLDYSQLADGTEGQLSVDDNDMREFGYTVIYLALVVYTMLFLFRYLKRLLMLTFLTIIAPLMAMTYPLDKIKDGNAQGFNMWLKEYMYNLLIQPVHLILYTVLIGSAMDLVVDNLLYALVALGFILQAEKILRKFFGFDKASTVDGGSALGGALAMQGLNQVSKLMGRKGNGDKEKEKVNGKNNQKTVPKRKGTRKEDELGLPPGSGDALEKGNNNNGEDSNSTGTEGNTPPTLDDNGGTPLQRMSDADAEAFGTSDFDPAEWNANAMDANEPEQLEKSDEEKREALRQSGYNEDEINDILRKPESEETDGESEIATETEEEPERTAETTKSESTPKGRKEKPHRIKAGAAYLGKKVLRATPKLAKGLAKGYVRYTTAGAGLLAGVTAGLVSDDFSNVAKMGAGGFAAGGMIGSSSASALNKAISAPGAVGRKVSSGIDGIIAATHTLDEMEDRENKKADKAWLKDKEIAKLYKDKLGLKSLKEAQQVMETEGKKYRDFGVTDDKIIIKAMKSDNSIFGKGRDADGKVLLAKFASKVGGDQKKLKYVKESLAKRGADSTTIANYEKKIKEMYDDDLI